MEPKILIGGIQHETNTFSPIATDLACFERGQFVRGNALIPRYRNTGTELGGMIAAAEELELRLAPTLFAVATPSGIVTRPAFETIVGELCDRASAHTGEILGRTHGLARSNGGGG